MSIEVRLDVFDLRRSVRELAASVGFHRYSCKALELVASELATNILKHGHRGVVCVEVFDEPTKGVGLRIEARDEGPLIENLDAAIADGWSRHEPIDPAHYYGRDGIGAGLGAIQRLSDEFAYTRVADGNLFTVIRYRTTAGIGYR